ncbi:hypothetical protein CGZ95_18105 [Enemella evansiae]|uniref:type IV toxin-antitoxin system AbiEi family antitoxin domain-containing protein n=1 Tax=Enemella evansiae TaxID=2016499 RepID=UPI000B973C53|nr:type IV toxin-antitoxin system AbiEi family antitoxin domain-containing protein [Enemella evansiae]OYN95611.1 hypothetical protein CGZ95_18105 [Enemella evansiae]
MFITSKELAAKGLRPHEIRIEVAAGRLIQVRRGVYRTPESDGGSSSDAGPGARTAKELEHLQRIEATVPRLRPGACLSHLSAALAHDLPVPYTMLGPVQITRPGASGKVGGSLHLHRGRVPTDHVVAGEHGPITSLAWTVMDLARVLPPIHAVAAVDRALARGLDRAEVLELLDEHRAPGNVTAREVVRFGDAASESVGESHSRWLMHELGVPAPRLQVKIYNEEGDYVARPDFLWDDCRVVGEFDGQIKYGRMLKPGQDISEVILAEKQREEALRRQGYWVIRWIWRDLDDREAFRKLLTRGRQLGFRAGA